MIHSQAKVNLSPGHMFDKDLELFVYYQDTHQPSAIVEAGVTTAPPGSLMRDPVVMISLYPEFPEEVIKSLGTQGEFVFVIDRSGSMDSMMFHGKGAQRRIESAKSVVYNQDTVDQALKRVKQMQADMGGTEILQHSKNTSTVSPVFPITPRQVTLTLTGVSHSGLVRVQVPLSSRKWPGRDLVSLSSSQTPTACSPKFAPQPAVVNISVDWTLPDGLTVDTLSPPINVLFQGERTLIYAQLKGESSGGTEGTVTVKYSLKGQPVTNQLHICLKPTEDTGMFVWLHSPAADSDPNPFSGARGERDCERTPAEKKSADTWEDVVFWFSLCSCTNSLEASHFEDESPEDYVNSVLDYECCLADSERASAEYGDLDYLENYDDDDDDGGGDYVSQLLEAAPGPRKDLLLELVSLQKASGCWELDVALADVFRKRKDELTNQKPAQVDGSVWATVLALIWLYSCKIEQQVEWQFVAMKAVSWISSQKVGDLSRCVSAGNVLLGYQVTKETLGI
ncbi:hypothetical protein QQF64_018746 [Cirrhinus molitorella]|uniref:von Willebrand factor A domain containing 5A n=1 Tax=Cirrhinus molitorella TaxID=172907 RepID=A0ABR3LEZ7_9TELE